MAHAHYLTSPPLINYSVFHRCYSLSLSLPSSLATMGRRMSTRARQGSISRIFAHSPKFWGDLLNLNQNRGGVSSFGSDFGRNWQVAVARRHILDNETAIFREFSKTLFAAFLLYSICFCLMICHYICLLLKMSFFAISTHYWTRQTRNP